MRLQSNIRISGITIILLMGIGNILCSPARDKGELTISNSIPKVPDSCRIYDMIGQFYKEAIIYSPKGYSFTSSLNESLKSTYSKIREDDCRFKYKQFRESLYLIFLKYHLSALRDQSTNYNLMNYKFYKDSIIKGLANDLFTIVFRNNTFCPVQNVKVNDDYAPIILQKCDSTSSQLVDVFLTNHFYYILCDSTHIITKSPFKEISDSIIKESEVPSYVLKKLNK
jgi:hypothetical protein